MTFIVAEIGSNWSTLDDCFRSIEAAKQCKADAVKFQLFTAEELYGYCPEGWDRRYELPMNWIPDLWRHCVDVGIEFMCTAFSPDGVEIVDPYVKRHKIASSDITALDILQAVGETKKPVILSTGAASQYNINMALMHLHAHGSQTDNNTLLYCVANYPARTVDLRIIDALRDAWKLPIGFSDHTTDYHYLPWAAVHQHGATVIEKHVNFVGAKGPDSPHSLNEKEFKHMVEMIRDPKPPVIGPTVEEGDMLMWHQRRLVTIGDNKGYYRIYPNS